MQTYQIIFLKNIYQKASEIPFIFILNFITIKKTESISFAVLMISLILAEMFFY